MVRSSRSVSSAMSYRPLPPMMPMVAVIFYCVAGPHPRDLCLRALRRSALVATTFRLVWPALLNVRFISCLPKFQPIERVFHQELARSFERIVLALRKALPVFGHQNAAAIR